MSVNIKEKKFRLHLVTWNVGNAEPPADLMMMLNLYSQPLPDIYGIGIQELSSGEFDANKNSWTSALTDILSPKGFCRLKSVKMQGILLVVFVRREHLLCFTHIESEISRAGMAGWWGNKGGVSIRFDINGVNLIIVNAHLAAHMNNSAERIEDFFTILDTQKFRDKDVENILDHDMVFWMGDLNFRIDKFSRHEVEKYIKKEEYSTLLKEDQLMKCREEDLIFCDFNEGQITFPPTYKFDPGTNNYDSSDKQRVPAWCDRILWLVHDDSFEHLTLAADQMYYNSLPSYLISDHKPVISAFDIKVFPCQRFPAPVTFCMCDKWQVGKEMDLKYIMSPDTELKSSDSDWIGLYKNDFKHLNDYVTWKWAVPDAEKSRNGVIITFSKRSLSVEPGIYRVCYISHYKMTLLGMSDEFEINK